MSFKNSVWDWVFFVFVFVFFFYNLKRAWKKSCNILKCVGERKGWRKQNNVLEIFTDRYWLFKGFEIMGNVFYFTSRALFVRGMFKF